MDTPRVDAEARKSFFESDPVKLARQLERENIRLREALETLCNEMEWYATRKKDLRETCPGIQRHGLHYVRVKKDQSWAENMLDEIKTARAALSQET